MKCARCGQERHSSQFRRSKYRTNGLVAQCKACDKELRFRNRKKIAEKCRLWAEKNPYRVWAGGTFQGHQRKGFEIRFTIAELEQFARQNKECAVCGRKLNFSYGEKGGRCVPESPTLDRISNQQVLTLRSVQMCCLQCNTTKGSRTMTQFVQYCEEVINRWFKI